MKSWEKNTNSLISGVSPKVYDKTNDKNYNFS